MFKIVAFVGKKGSGKSTASSILKEYIGSSANIHHLSFSEPLKSFASELYPTHKQYFFEPELKERSFVRGRSARFILTALAKAVRSIDPYAFTNSMAHKLINIKTSSADEEETYVLIDDVRFEQEFDMLTRLDATFIFMNPEKETFYEKVKRIISVDVNPSERGLNHRYSKNSHFAIDNVGKTMLELQREVKKIFLSDFSLYDYHNKLNGVN